MNKFTCFKTDYIQWKVSHAHRLFGANPVSEQMLARYESDIWEQIGVKSEWKWNSFYTRKSIQDAGHLKWPPFSRH